MRGALCHAPLPRSPDAVIGVAHEREIAARLASADGRLPVVRRSRTLSAAGLLGVHAAAPARADPLWRPRRDAVRGERPSRLAGAGSGRGAPAPPRNPRPGPTG